MLEAEKAPFKIMFLNSTTSFSTSGDTDGLAALLVNEFPAGARDDGGPLLELAKLLDIQIC